MPKKTFQISEKFLLIVFVITCCTILMAIGKMNSDDYQAVVVMALLIYGGHSAWRKWREKKELEKFND